MQMSYAPLRTLQDVEELERVPLDQRVFSWNLNDWIAPRLRARSRQDRASATSPTAIPTASRSCSAIANCKRAPSRRPICSTRSACRPDDVVLYVLPTLPQLYVAMLGAVGRGHRLRRQLDAQAASSWPNSIRATSAKVIVDARADARLRDLGEPAGDPRRNFARRCAFSRCRGRAAQLDAGIRLRHARRTPARRPAAVRSARSSPTTSPPTCIPAAPPARPSW